jgi:hypothetical protein
MITAETITSAKNGREYRLFFHDGKLTGCSCGSRKYHPREACKHMKAWQQKQLDERRTAYNYYEMSIGII